MQRIAVIYSSKYGAAKKYATWISEALGADLFDKKKTDPARIKSYGLVVYGGGIYAGGISGIKFILGHKPKNLVVFTVGLWNPETTDYTSMLKKNFDPAALDEIKVFHLRGGIDYKRLGIADRAMLAVIKKFVMDRKAPGELTEEDRVFLKTYGGNVDYTDRSAIKPIIDYIRAKP